MVGRQGLEPWTHGLRVLLVSYLSSFIVIYQSLLAYINQNVTVI
jgi:hypothetical protein